MRSIGPATAHCSGKSMRPKARWRASSWRWYFETALIIGSVSGCSLACFCRRSGTSSPLRTSRQKSDGIAVRKGMSTCWAMRPIGLSRGFLALGWTCSRSRMKRREWRVSSPISCSRYVTRGSVRSGRERMSRLNPAIRTDSKRTPVSTMDANSSRARVRFCSSVSRSNSSGTLARLRSSSGSTWPCPMAPGTSVSGSTMRLSEAVERRSMRWSTFWATGPDVVVVIVVSMVEAIPVSSESKPFGQILISPGRREPSFPELGGSPGAHAANTLRRMSTPLPQTDSGPSAGGRSRSRRLLLVGAGLAAGAAAGAVYKRHAALGARAGTGESGPDAGTDDARVALGWGEGVSRPDHQIVRTPDGAELAVWDLAGAGLDAPVVVLPHCWGCSHEIWLPVARRLREQGYRVVLYDQRGHGASTRGTVPLSIETLAHDLATVLDATDPHNAVLAGHSMGGMTIMSLATHRPDVLKQRAKATVLVATAATNAGGGPAPGTRVANALVASRFVTLALQSKKGHVFVRGAFGENPVRAHMDLTRDLFGSCHGAVRGDFLLSMSTMDLLEGAATIAVPTTVMVGTRDTLTLPKKADQIVATVPGARLITLQNRGHMLPLEDPDAVTDEIVRAVKG